LNTSDAELEEFIVKIVRATNRGISAVKNVTSSNPNWSFGQSMFFADIVINTIAKRKTNIIIPLRNKQ
jgi:potassium channel subfamily K protein 1